MSAIMSNIQFVNNPLYGLGIMLYLLSISLPLMSCNNGGLSQCLKVGHSIHAWYDGTSVEINNNLWKDKSGNNNNGQITSNEGIKLFDGSDTTNTELYLNGHKIVTGTFETRITFNVELNPSNHTVFSLAKYRNNAPESHTQRLLNTDIDNGLFGFYAGFAGCAYENGWITNVRNPANNAHKQWLVSSQQQDLYRGNYIDLTVNKNVAGFENINKILINDGKWTTGAQEWSDFAIAELIVSNDKLDLNEIKCIENYIKNKYFVNTLRPTATPNNPTKDPTQDPTNDPTKDPTKDPTSDPTHDPTKDPTNDPTKDPTQKL